MPQTQGLHEVREGAPLEEPATCANCGGPHPANHTACPQYRREVRNKRAGTVVLTTIIQRPPKPSGQPQQDPKTTLVTIDRAIDTLKEVLVALREGRDPIQTVLDGMMRLLRNNNV